MNQKEKKDKAVARLQAPSTYTAFMKSWLKLNPIF